MVETWGLPLIWEKQVYVFWIRGVCGRAWVPGRVLDVSRLKAFGFAVSAASGVVMDSNPYDPPQSFWIRGVCGAPLQDSCCPIKPPQSFWIRGVCGGWQEVVWPDVVAASKLLDSRCLRRPRRGAL